MIIRIAGIIRTVGIIQEIFFSTKYVMCNLKSIAKALVVEISIISNALKASLPELHGDLKSLF